MIKEIKGNPFLAAYVKESCEDNGICVSIDRQKLDENDYAIIKVDEYYEALRLGDTPSSIDFLVSVDCVTNHYTLYLMEFKNVKDRDGFTPSNVRKKFDTVIHDFMSERFGDIFQNSKYQYKDILAYFVHNLLTSGNTYPKDTTRREIELFREPYEFMNKTILIRDINPEDLIVKRIT